MYTIEWALNAEYIRLTLCRSLRRESLVRGVLGSGGILLINTRQLATNFCAIFLIAFFAQSSHAHTTGENYAFLNVDDDALRVRLEINEQELESWFGLSVEDGLPDDAAIVPVLDYVAQHFEVREGGVPLELTYQRSEILALKNTSFLQLFFDANWLAEMPQRLTIRQALFFERDARHRGLVLIERNAVTGADLGPEYTALVFGPDREVQELDLVNVPGLVERWDFLWQGAWHILIGYDHILFLLTLLLTSVLVPVGAGWAAEKRFSRAFLNVAGIVTVFTVAHSVSLGLAALEIVKLPSRPVEMVIALSIIVMAVHNIRPFLPGRWIVIFLFGLFHGLGFATVLGHLAFRMVDVLPVLVLFNVGVELGQLAIVFVAFPLLYSMRDKSWFVPVVVKAGSAAILAVAAYWLLERAFF